MILKICFAFFCLSWQLHALNHELLVEAIQADDLPEVKRAVQKCYFSRKTELNYSWAGLASLAGCSRELVSFLESREMKTALQDLFDAISNKRMKDIVYNLESIDMQDLEYKNEEGHTALEYAKLHKNKKAQEYIQGTIQKYHELTESFDSLDEESQEMWYGYLQRKEYEAEYSDPEPGVPNFGRPYCVYEEPVRWPLRTALYACAVVIGVVGFKVYADNK
jgi:hypothetical protein